jgi:hypothetical protein
MQAVIVVVLAIAVLILLVVFMGVLMGWFGEPETTASHSSATWVPRALPVPSRVCSTNTGRASATHSSATGFARAESCLQYEHWHSQWHAQRS